MQRRVCAFCFSFHVLKYYKLKGIKNETAIECNKCVIVNMLCLFIISIIYFKYVSRYLFAKKLDINRFLYFYSHSYS